MRADRVSDALARLDRRLDQVIAEGRAAASEHRARYTPPPPRTMMPPAGPGLCPAPPRMAAPVCTAPAPQPQAAPSRGPAHWAAQISARQRMLEGGAAGGSCGSSLPPPAALSRRRPMERRVGFQRIAAPASPPQHPDFHAASALRERLNALRSDLAEIGRHLTEAMPRRAIEALEGEVRALAERVDRTRAAGADGAALGALERELAEVRQALRGLTPAENLAGFEDAVRGLYQKIDQLAASGQSAQGDPMAFKQLEQAVVSLRGVVSNVASDGALEQLAAEVRGLGAQFERATQDSSNEALGRLEQRISSLMESGRSVPPELEGAIRELSERFDRMQMSQGDHMALGALEDRIAKLSEKLDTSDARLGHLEAIERGLADLLVYLEEMRCSSPRGLRAPPNEPAPAPVAAPPRPAEPPAPMPMPAPAAMQSPLDMIPELAACAGTGPDGAAGPAVAAAGATVRTGRGRADAAA